MTRRLLLALLLVAGVFPASSGRALQPTAAGLLVDAPAAADPLAQPALSRPGTVQARAVAVNVEALSADVLDLALFPGVTLQATLSQRMEHPDGSVSWSGQVVGQPLSAVTFVRLGTVLQGSLRLLGAAYSIEPIGDTGVHVVREIDLSQLGEELPPLVPELELAVPHDPPVSGDDGSTFDVLVVYTPAARAAAGGTDAAIQARINLGITDTNTAYANSGVIPRLRLVGAEVVSYTESGDLSADLNALTGTADGQMDGVHARRNALGADLVQLIVGSTAGGACGVAWLMTTLSPAFAGHAFSVTAEPCISPNYTFGHELGHNMGSNHAPDDPVSSTPLYPYSFGYKHPAGLFRTVMAYNCGGGCPRILHFSNPSVSYGGQPTGTAGQHNNALSINNARGTIANWRQAVGGGNTAPTISTIANRTTLEDTPTASIGFTVGDAETAAGSLTVSATSSNPALVANVPGSFAFGGSGANRTLVVTPQANANGLATITVTVSDGALSASTSFQLSVTAVNDPPVVSPIGLQTTNEDQPLTVPFTVSDVETAAGSLTVTATSSNTVLVPPSAIGLGGSGGNRVVTLAPAADQSGTTTITLTVSDGAASTPATFTLTVVAVNDAPAFVGLPPLVSTTVGVPAALSVTISDADSAGASLTLAVSSANTLLLPPSGIAVVPTGVTASTRTFQVTLSPAAGQSGSSALTFTAGDGASTTPVPVAFNVTTVVTAPHAPTAVSAAASGTSVRIAWTPALTGSTPASFVIEIGTSAGTTTLPTQQVPWPATTHTLTLPAGVYFLRVRAVNGAGASPPSPEASVEVVEPALVPGPPGNFSARVSGRTVSFTWTAAMTGAPATRYVLEAGSGPGLANLGRIDTGVPNTSLEVPNVPAGTYWVRVRGGNAAGTGAPSQDVAIVMGATSGCVGLPGAPVMLTPIVSGNHVTLHWNAPVIGGLPAGYVLMAGSAPGASNLALLPTGGAATAFAASGPSGLYWVRVAASNACGVGPVSNEVGFTLGADLPGPPRDLAFTVAPGGLVTLTWSAPASGAPPTAYLLEAGSQPGLANLATVSTGSIATTFSATASPGVYHVRVRAVNGAGPGMPTDDVVVVVP